MADLTSSATTEPHPIDFSVLTRGMVVTAEAIERAYGIMRTEDTYWRSQLRLRAAIRQYFEQQYGDIVSVRSKGHALEILTHQQQAEYVERGEAIALLTFARRHVEDMGINEAELTEEQRARRQRRITRSAALLSFKDRKRLT